MKLKKTSKILNKEEYLDELLWSPINWFIAVDMNKSTDQKDDSLSDEGKENKETEEKDQNKDHLEMKPSNLEEELNLAEDVKDNSKNNDANEDEQTIDEENGLKSSKKEENELNNQIIEQNEDNDRIEDGKENLNEETINENREEECPTSNENKPRNENTDEKIINEHESEDDSSEKIVMVGVVDRNNPLAGLFDDDSESSTEESSEDKNEETPKKEEQKTDRENEITHNKHGEEDSPLYTETPFEENLFLMNHSFPQNNHILAFPVFAEKNGFHTSLPQLDNTSPQNNENLFDDKTTSPQQNFLPIPKFNSFMTLDTPTTESQLSLKKPSRPLDKIPPLDLSQKEFSSNDVPKSPRYSFVKNEKGEYLYDFSKSPKKKKSAPKDGQKKSSSTKIDPKPLLQSPNGSPVEKAEVNFINRIRVGRNRKIIQRNKKNEPTHSYNYVPNELTEPQPFNLGRKDNLSISFPQPFVPSQDLFPNYPLRNLVDKKRKEALQKK